MRLTTSGILCGFPSRAPATPAGPDDGSVPA